MNKIFTLYDMEFKSVYKKYIALIGIMIVANIGIFMVMINNIINVSAIRYKVSLSLNLLSYPVSQQLLGDSMGYFYGMTNIVLAIGVILCLIYGVVIWYKDFIGKNKTAYTLFMLPQNKFNIYISKFVTMLMLIYGVMFTQVTLWIIAYKMIDILININIVEINNIMESIVHYELNLIQPYIRDFMMIDVLGVMVAITVIFTGVLIQKLLGKKGVVVGISYVILSITGFIMIFYKSVYDEVFISHAIYLSVLFAISTAISYGILNKKINI